MKQRLAPSKLQVQNTVKSVVYNSLAVWLYLTEKGKSKHFYGYRDSFADMAGSVSNQ